MWSTSWSRNMLLLTFADFPAIQCYHGVKSSSSTKQYVEIKVKRKLMTFTLTSSRKGSNIFLFYSYRFLFPCGCLWMNFKLRGFQWYVAILRTHVDNHCRNTLIRARLKNQFRFDRYSLRFEVRAAAEPNPFGMWFASKTLTRICGYCKISNWLISAWSKGGKCCKKCMVASVLGG